MQVVVKNAGGQSGALILNEEGNWRINAHCTNREDCLLQSIPVEESEVIPLTLINYVKRTKETLIFDDASNQPRFASDPYIIQHQPQSLLCTPISERGKMMGILYLENNLATGYSRAIASPSSTSWLPSCNFLTERPTVSAIPGVCPKTRALSSRSKQMQLQLVQGEKMSAIGNLVAGVAHEINNPVGFITGNLQPAQEYLQDLFELIDVYQDSFPKPGAKVEEKIEAIDLEYLREDLPKLIGSMQE